jgi:hypothetical protein
MKTVLAQAQVPNILGIARHKRCVENFRTTHNQWRSALGIKNAQSQSMGEPVVAVCGKVQVLSGGSRSNSRTTAHFAVLEPVAPRFFSDTGFYCNPVRCLPTPRTNNAWPYKQAAFSGNPPESHIGAPADFGHTSA